MAIDFDLACTTRLLIFDQEREKRMYEAMGISSVTNALGGSPTVDRSSPTALNT